MTGADGRARHGRLPWLLPEDLTAEQREYYDGLVAGPRDKAALTDDQGRLHGAFNARLLDPKIGTAIQQLGAVLRFATPALAGRQRELAILEVARHEQSGYEWLAHARTGRAAGLLPEEIQALHDGLDAETFEPAEKLTRRVVRTLMVERDLADDLFGEAERVLGLIALFDLISLVGYYQHTALSLRVWRVPLGTPDNPFPDGHGADSAPGS
jgi:alkylhydroperoxidase family enzyme